jgi:hypothetical protein
MESFNEIKNHIILLSDQNLQFEKISNFFGKNFPEEIQTIHQIITETSNNTKSNSQALQLVWQIIKKKMQEVSLKLRKLYLESQYIKSKSDETLKRCFKSFHNLNSKKALIKIKSQIIIEKKDQLK